MPLKYTLGLLSVMFLWSFNPICLNMVIMDINSCWLGFFRFFPLFILTALLSIGEARNNVAGTNFPNSRLFIHFIFSGFILFVQVFLFHFGSKFTTPNCVALFAFSFPLYAPFFAHFIFKLERLTWLKVLGNAVAFTGIFLVFYRSGHVNYFGNFTELCSALIISLFMTYTKFLIVKTGNKKWMVLCFQMLFASLFFLLAALASDQTDFFNLPRRVYFALFYQIIVVSMFCWSCLQFFLSKLPVTIVTSFFFLPPILTQLVNSFFETGNTFELLPAGLTVAIGIILVNIDTDRSIHNKDAILQKSNLNKSIKVARLYRGLNQKK